MFYTLKEAATLLKNSHFLYKGKTIVNRTVLTMADNGVFKSLRYCECGKCRIVSEEEITSMSNSSV